MISVLVLFLYPIAIQYERGGIWRVLLPLYIITALLDVVANYTEISLLLLEWPKPKQYTVSKRISYLIPCLGWKGSIAYMVARYLNYFSANHIPEISNVRTTNN